MSKLSITLLVLILVTPPDALARCGPSRPGGGVTKPEVITLNALARGVRDAPAFYMQFPQKSALLYFKPEDVVELLEKTSARYRSEQLGSAAQNTDAYLAAIRRDLPLKQDTDFFKYVLENNEFYFRQQYMVSDLLKLGQVHIDTFPYGDAKQDPADDRGDRKTLVMVSKRSEYEEEWRQFCEPLKLDENPRHTRDFYFVSYISE